MPDALTYYDQTRHILETRKSLLTNGSIEAPFSGTVIAFDDQFADLNAWTTTGTPTVAANLVSMPVGSTMTGGHPEWWDHSAGSRIRFRWNAGGVMRVHMRYVDGNNWVRASMGANNWSVGKQIDGVPTGLVAPTNVAVDGNFYWFEWSISGTTYTISLHNDNAGALGTKIGNTEVHTVADPQVATGKIHIISEGAAMAVGGAFADVCLVKIPTPPNWVTAAITGTPAWAVSKTNKASGLYSLSVYINNASHRGDWQNTHEALVIGNWYAMSGRIRTSGAATGRWGEASFNPLMTAFGSADWALGTNVGTAGAATTSFACVASGGVGTVWFDNIWFGKGTFIPRSFFK